MPPSKWLHFTCILLLVSLLVATPACAGSREDWPNWSSPQAVNTGNRHFGFQSTSVADDTIFIATVSEAADALLITSLDNRKKYDIPVANLVSYSICARGAEVAAVWSERNGSISTLWLQLGTKTRIMLTQGEKFIADVSASSDEHDRLFVAWAGGSANAEGIYLSVVEAGVAREPLQLTFGQAQDRSPKVVAANASLHLTFKRDRVLFTELHYKSFFLDQPQTPRSTIIGNTSRESKNRPLLSINEDGSSDIFWLQSTLWRGQERGSTLVKGRLSAAGEWLEPLSALMEQPGANVSLSLAQDGAGERLLAWLSDATGTFQAYYLALDARDTIVEGGPVTRTHGNKFGTQVHAQAISYVLFYELSGDRLTVMYVDDYHVQPVPWAVFLGLDPEMPLLDVFYTLVATTASALVITLLASLLIIPLVFWLGRFAPIRRAHFLLSIGIFNVFLRVVASAYLERVLLPSWVGLATMGLAIGLAYATLCLCKLDEREPLTLGAFSLLYAFFLFFISLIVRTAYSPQGGAPLCRWRETWR